MSGLTIAALRSLTSCVNSRSSLAVSPTAQPEAASTRTAIANRCFMIAIPAQLILRSCSAGWMESFHNEFFRLIRSLDKEQFGKSGIIQASGEALRLFLSVAHHITSERA